MTISEGFLTIAFVFGCLGVIAVVVSFGDMPKEESVSRDCEALFLAFTALALFAVAALFAIAAGVWK